MEIDNKGFIVFCHLPTFSALPTNILLKIIRLLKCHICIQKCDQGCTVCLENCQNNHIFCLKFVSHQVLEYWICEHNALIGW